MGRPPKPHLQLVTEKKSHRTKAELEQRKSQEDGLLTKIKIKEFNSTKSNEVAHKEFLRIINLYKKIDKNDDLFAGVLNRYCMLKAECFDFEEKRETFYKNLSDLEEEWEKQYLLPKEEREISSFEYFKLKSQMQGQIISLDKQVQNKRKMMLDIEKENLMTISSALRSIPKKVIENDMGQSEEEKLFGGNL